MSPCDELAGLHAVERRFLMETLERLHARDPWTRGLFAETLVASALDGARRTAHSAAPHDLEWAVDGRALKIAVRATGSYSMDHKEGDGRRPFAGAWKFPRGKYAWDAASGSFVDGVEGAVRRRCWSDVVVLCRHDSLDILRGWTFHVLPGQAIEKWPSETLTPSSVAVAGFLAIDGEALPASVRHAAQEAAGSDLRGPD